MAKAALVNLGDGCSGRVARSGTETIFWIHGYTLDSSCWARLWDLLPEFTHVGVDLPGHGSSLPLDRAEDLPALARRMGALAITHEARHIAAVSFGTAVALQAACEYPGSFASLTLASPVLGGGPFAPDLWARYREVQACFRATGHGPHLRDRWMGGGASLFADASRHPALEQHLRRQVGSHPWWELADDAYETAWRAPQALRELARIRLPTLLLVGADDCQAVKQGASFLERVLANSRRLDLEGLGHLGVLGHPGPVVPLVREFCRAHPVIAAATKG